MALIRDGDTVATTGYGGNGTPDLGAELRKRRLSSHVFEARREARHHLGKT